AAAGINVAVDTSGPALVSAVTAGPALVKPNREELAEATGVQITTLGDAIGAACKLRAMGAGTVLASLGPDGAVLVEDDHVWYGRCPVTEPRSAVGAGGAMLAGFLAAGARGEQPLDEDQVRSNAVYKAPGARMPYL